MIEQFYIEQAARFAQVLRHLAVFRRGGCTPAGVIVSDDDRGAAQRDGRAKV